GDGSSRSQGHRGSGWKTLSGNERTMRLVNTLILGILLAATARGSLAQTTQPAATPASKPAAKAAKKPTAKNPPPKTRAKPVAKPTEGAATAEGEARAGRRDPFES